MGNFPTHVHPRKLSECIGKVMMCKLPLAVNEHLQEICCQRLQLYLLKKKPCLLMNADVYFCSPQNVDHYRRISLEPQPSSENENSGSFSTKKPITQFIFIHIIWFWHLPSVTQKQIPLITAISVWGPVFSVHVLHFLFHQLPHGLKVTFTPGELNRCHFLTQPVKGLLFCS